MGPAFHLQATPGGPNGRRISYSLYLIHIPVFEVFWTMTAHTSSLAAGLPDAGWLAPHAVLVSVLLAHLLFRYVEEPARAWLRQRDLARWAASHRVSMLSGPATSRHG